MAYRAIIHVVGIDVFYKATDDVLSKCVVDTLSTADGLEAGAVAIPAFATGYGRHPLSACGAAMKLGFLQVEGRLRSLRRIEIWLRDQLRLDEFTRGWYNGSIVTAP